MLTVEAFDHLVLNVRNVDVSAAWYERVLGMTREDAEPAPGQAVRTSVKFGNNKINLRPMTATQEDWFTGATPQAGSDDLCFLTGTSPDDVVDHFRKCCVEIVLGPVIKKGARGPIRSVYVRDPDGNLIEVSSYG
jgi:catechol 2,3-dioxygenase-like lactoylglutathione lyase family enzyme